MMEGIQTKIQSRYLNEFRFKLEKQSISSKCFLIIIRLPILFLGRYFFLFSNRRLSLHGDYRKGHPLKQNYRGKGGYQPRLIKLKPIFILKRYF